MNDYDFHAELVRDLLINDQIYSNDWSTQGFGMARLYLTEDHSVRLNIWHSSLAVDGLTPETGMVHTHPWDFTSRIVCGELRNQRYRWFNTNDEEGVSPLTWCCAEITPGPGGHFTDAEGRATQPSGHNSRRFGILDKADRYADTITTTRTTDVEVYGPDDTYSQTFQEIHHTEYVDGTVTINRRHRGDRPDRAFTFWKADREWISAEPKAASRQTGLGVALDAALELLS